MATFLPMKSRGWLIRTGKGPVRRLQLPARRLGQRRERRLALPGILPDAGRQLIHEGLETRDALGREQRRPRAVACVQIGRERGVACLCQALADVLQICVHAPRLLDHDDPRQGQRRAPREPQAAPSSRRRWLRLGGRGSP